MTRMLLMAGFVILFSQGCDVQSFLSTQPTPEVHLELRPGYAIMVGDKKAYVHGNSRCSDGDPDCVLIGPYTEVVEVWVTDAKGTRREAWTVERKENVRTLHGANGSVILPAE